MAKPVVAIVGRPNVGKSTFFNRCVGARHAIVDDSPGVTRDRIYRETDWSGREFLLVDTGGVIPNSPESIANEVFDQVQLAVDEADVIVFMVDGKAGMSGADEEVANLLRRSKKPIIVAVNKIDEPREEPNAMEFYGLGLGDPHSLSAMRGSGGVGDLLDKVIAHFPPETRKVIDLNSIPYDGTDFVEEEEQGPLSLAIVGRPNVGKSSLVNVLVGTNRSIVSNVPGTTRDAIDSKIKFQGKEYVLVDTAGIRRKSRVDYGIEAFAVVRSLRALERADVVILILDATQEISDQDQKIAGKIDEAGRACVIVVNKWDLIDDKSSRLMKEFVENIKTELRSIAFSEVIFTSAINKQRVTKIIEAADRAHAMTKKRIGTGLLNQIVNESVALVPPPSSKRGKRLKVYYTTQVSTAPPTFILFGNDDKLMTKNYESYIERKLREAFGFEGTPIRIVTRAKKDNR
ncbi:MAG: ribosome biogenesis GTPase Der [Candidatus Melainabacteria bacterium]|nr:ribosome biogenesis GTPase Der [Candidatus Melainabacteria bacterium]